MRARITIESGDARPPSLDLEPNQAASLGRSRDNTIVLRSEHASRLHAKILFEDDAWQIQDFSLNGIALDGQRIQQRAPLDDGQEIRIGEIKLRFHLPDQRPSSSVSRVPGVESRERSHTSTHLSTFRLQAAEATALCAFMAVHAGATDALPLLRAALKLLVDSSGAYVAGFLSPDAGDPLPKAVVPDSAGIDHAFSRQLTRRTQRTGKSYWLGTSVGESHASDGLKEITDALCVPVRSGNEVLGMLHLYKKRDCFADRDLRLSEAMAGFLGGCLRGARDLGNLQAECNRLRFHPPSVDDVIGDSTPMVRLRKQMSQVAGQPLPILIQSEPGCGVDVVAHSLHRQSARKDGPFVAAFTASMAPATLDAELFGSQGANGKPGKSGLCLLADEGTLYIDEVADLPLDAQSRLQRFIEEKCFRPAGAAIDMRSDVRIIAATQVDLESAVDDHRFRRSLFDLLSRIVLPIPPLRTHLDDVPYLVQYFLDKLEMQTRRHVTLTDAAMHKLQSYVWPGNHMQLRAELEAAVLRSNRDVIDENDLLTGCDKLLLVR